MNSRTLMCALTPIAMIACAGCMIPARSISPEEFAKRVKIDTSPYDNVDYINSQQLSKYLGLNSEVRWHLRTIRHKRGHSIVAHQLCAKIQYTLDRWIFYEQASDNEARMLSVHVLDRDVWVMGPRSTQFTEVVAIDLPDDYLKVHRTDGFSVRVSNKNGGGSIVIELLPNYVEGHLYALTQPDASSPKAVGQSRIGNLPREGRVAQVFRTWGAGWH